MPELDYYLVKTYIGLKEFEKANKINKKLLLQNPDDPKLAVLQLKIMHGLGKEIDAIDYMLKRNRQNKWYNTSKSGYDEEVLKSEENKDSSDWVLAVLLVLIPIILFLLRN